MKLRLIYSIRTEAKVLSILLVILFGSNTSVIAADSTAIISGMTFTDGEIAGTIGFMTRLSDIFQVSEILELRGEQRNLSTIGFLSLPVSPKIRIGIVGSGNVDYSKPPADYEEIDLFLRAATGIMGTYRASARLRLFASYKYVFSDPLEAPNKFSLGLLLDFK